MSTSSTPDRAIIVHGYAATPADHWFTWLKEQFDSAGIPATVPELPDPHSPDAERWLDTVSGAIGIPDQNTVVVAHSLGCLTTLRHLTSLAAPWRLGALVLVSGFLEQLPALPNLDGYIGNGCEVGAVGADIDRMLSIRSDLDPYVPTEHSDRLAEKIGSEVRVVRGAGHFLASDGIDSLPEVFEFVDR